MGTPISGAMPEDVKQICLWLVRGYERRKRLTQGQRQGGPSEGAACEWKRMEAVERALAAVGSDILSEDVRERLRAAILLNTESGRAYPYERLDLGAVSRSEFYRRKDQFLTDIAAYLGML